MLVLNENGFPRRRWRPGTVEKVNISNSCHFVVTPPRGDGEISHFVFVHYKGIEVAQSLVFMPM